VIARAQHHPRSIQRGGGSGVLARRHPSRNIFELP